MEELAGWSTEQRGILVAAVLAVLLLAFALGVEVGSAMTAEAFVQEGLDCGASEALIWS